jgi:hypothetical protein
MSPEWRSKQAENTVCIPGLLRMRRSALEAVANITTFAICLAMRLDAAM